MDKIIETHLSTSISGEFDHQSRVIEVESWEDYIEDIKNKKSVEYQDLLGSMSGRTLPIRDFEIRSLRFDEYHASCTIINFKGQITEKVMYRIGNRKSANMKC